MLMPVVATGGCTESALKVDSGTEKNPLSHRGLEPASVLRLASQSDALPTELSPPLESKHEVKEVKMCLSRQIRYINTQNKKQIKADLFSSIDFII